MAKNVLWLRVGDGDDYHEFDDLDEIAEHSPVTTDP
jgi:hypothetical protein